MGELLPFPKAKIELNEEEYEEYFTFIEKMKKAKTKAEMDFYYYQAKGIVEKAIEEKNQSQKK